MCGRFTLTVSIEEIAKRFDAGFEENEWHPRYNIAPAQEVLAIVAERTGKKRISRMVWGLIPHWSHDRKIGYKMINARAETLHEKPSYKMPFKRQRCLIPADGYYEWKEDGTGKVPFRFVLKGGGLFGMAGIWDVWQDGPENPAVISFSIITTKANPLCRQFHDRMPALIRREDEAAWLDLKLQDLSRLQAMLEPFPGDEMGYYEVLPLVNSWKNDTEECIKPA